MSFLLKASFNEDFFVFDVFIHLIVSRWRQKKIFQKGFQAENEGFK